VVDDEVSVYIGVIQAEPTVFVFLLLTHFFHFEVDLDVVAPEMCLAVLVDASLRVFFSLKLYYSIWLRSHLAALTTTLLLTLLPIFA
jgi:hypothetical protein